MDTQYNAHDDTSARKSNSKLIFSTKRWGKVQTLIATRASYLCKGLNEMAPKSSFSLCGPPVGLSKVCLEIFPRRYCVVILSTVWYAVAGGYNASRKRVPWPLKVLSWPLTLSTTAKSVPCLIPRKDCLFFPSDEPDIPGFFFLSNYYYWSIHGIVYDNAPPPPSRFALGASNACLVGESSTCFVTAL